MKSERTNGRDEERQRDRDWIAANRELFWLAATVAYEELGRGAIVVDLAAEPSDEGLTFSYFTEGELELEDEDLHNLLNDYDPDREFVIILQKDEGRAAAYYGYRPLPGWHAEMKIQTPYGVAQNEE